MLVLLVGISTTLIALLSGCEGAQTTITFVRNAPQVTASRISITVTSKNIEVKNSWQFILILDHPAVSKHHSQELVFDLL